MIICDRCDSRNPPIENYRFCIYENGDKIQHSKDVDLCVRCYSFIVNKWRELFTPEPKVAESKR